MVPRTKTLHKKTTATLNDPQQQKTELNMFEVNIISWFLLVPKHSLVLDSQDVPWKKKTNSLVSDSFTMVTFSRKLPRDLSRQAFPTAHVRGVMTFATWAPIKMSVVVFQAKEKRGAVKMKKSVSLSQNVVNFN